MIGTIRFGPGLVRAGGVGACSEPRSSARMDARGEVGPLAGAVANEKHPATVVIGLRVIGDRDEPPSHRGQG
jgi:hypothetical protein